MHQYLIIIILTKQQIQNIQTELTKNDNQLTLIFEALGDQGRFRIFKLLIDYHGLCVTDIAKVFKITISAASQQLKILERVGLAEKIRMGQMVCYKIKQNLTTRHIKRLLKVD